MKESNAKLAANAVMTGAAQYFENYNYDYKAISAEEHINRAIIHLLEAEKEHTVINLAMASARIKMALEMIVEKESSFTEVMTSMSKI